jgi:transposase
MIAALMKIKQKKKLRRVRVVVRLKARDLAYLKNILNSGTRKAREITRARILLMSHKKKSNQEIIDALGCSQFAISDLRRRFVKRGRDVRKTIIDAPRCGTPRKILPVHEAFVVATACTEAPSGHAHWTTEALKEKLLETYADLKTVSDEGVRKILLKNKLKPWRGKNVVRSNAHASLSRADG